MAVNPLVLYRMGLGPLIAKQAAILTTRDRKTGLLQHSPIAYAREGDIFYTASVWGEPAVWHENLQADPDAALQIGNWRFAVKAEFLSTPEEMEEMLAASRQSDNLALAQKTAQALSTDQSQVKAVRLVPTGYPAEDGLPTDLVWIWGVVGGTATFMLVRRLFGRKKKPAEPKAPETPEAHETPEEPKKRKTRGRKKGKAEGAEEREKPRKGDKVKLMFKLMRVAPTFWVVARKLSSKKPGDQGEGEGAGKGKGPTTKDLLDIASMLTSAMRQLWS